MKLTLQQALTLGFRPDKWQISEMTHNLLQQEKSLKRGIKTKRLVAALDDSYLLKVLGVTLNVC